MKVYINYPNSQITIHRKRGCAHIQMQGKDKQRVLFVTSKNLGDALSDIAEKKYPFWADKEGNDLWIDIILDTDMQNESFVHIAQALLGQYYKPIKEAEIIKHNCK